MFFKKENVKKNKSYGVIGMGRFGGALATMLAESGKEVIAIDKNENKVRNIRKYTDCAFVTDDLSMESLRETGIQNCDVVIICVGEKVDVSILTTMSVLEMGVPRVISKAVTQEQGAVLEKLGAEVVYPERDMALRVGKKLLSNSLLDYVELLDGVEIRQLQATSNLIGKTVEEAQIRKKYHLNIIAIENGKTTECEVLPSHTIREGDILVVVGKVVNLDEFSNAL